jgi:hypothetical protein
MCVLLESRLALSSDHRRTYLWSLYKAVPSFVSKIYLAIVSLWETPRWAGNRGWMMALLDFARRRPVGLLHAPSRSARAAGVGRQQSRIEIAVEIGRTMLILMLIALSIVALRYVLVVAHSVVH